MDSPRLVPAAGPGADVRARLRLALAGALRARDTVAASALRSALSAIGNAGAVDPGAEVTTGPGRPPATAPGSPPAAAPGSPYVAGAATGLGATEVRRRGLSTAEAEQIVRAEIGERERAAREYERAGHADRAGRLRREARVLMAAVAGEGQPGHEAGPGGPGSSGPAPKLA